VPEGDAIHRAAAALRVLVGERISAESPHPQGAATGVAEAIDGRLLEGVDAIGKNVVLRFEGGVALRSHLRMSGRWRVQRRDDAVHGRPWLVLRGGEWTAIQRHGPVLTLQTRFRAHLGPDVLDDAVETDELVRRLRAADPRQLLGSALLDQRLLAGIGNMWAAEALWQGRVSPWLPVGEATDEELEAALTWVRAAMRAAVGGRRSPRSVYRHAGRPCPRCGERIRSRGLGDANRTAYWCPACQRGPEVGRGARSG
jgi:endonuclease VIII